MREVLMAGVQRHKIKTEIILLGKQIYKLINFVFWKVVEKYKNFWRHKRGYVILKMKRLRKESWKMSWSVWVEEVWKERRGSICGGESIP